MLQPEKRAPAGAGRPAPSSGGSASGGAAGGAALAQQLLRAAAGGDHAPGLARGARGASKMAGEGGGGGKAWGSRVGPGWGGGGGGMERLEEAIKGDARNGFCWVSFVTCRRHPSWWKPSTSLGVPTWSFAAWKQDRKWLPSPEQDKVDGFQMLCWNILFASSSPAIYENRMLAVRAPCDEPGVTI